MSKPRPTPHQLLSGWVLWSTWSLAIAVALWPALRLLWPRPRSGEGSVLGDVFFTLGCLSTGVALLLLGRSIARSLTQPRLSERTILELRVAGGGFLLAGSCLVAPAVVAVKAEAAVPAMFLAATFLAWLGALSLGYAQTLSRAMAIERENEGFI